MAYFQGICGTINLNYFSFSFIGLLFSEFRFGWDTSIYAIPHKPCNKPTFQTFMVTVVKEKLGASNPVRSLFDHSAVNCNAKQVK